MNPRRGFLRLYAVAVVCWLAAFVVIAFNNTSGSLELIIAVAVGVPVAIYVLLFVVAPWIWRGFKSGK